MMDIITIKQIIPHRYPFLLVDRILESTSDEIVGIKNVSANEGFFEGHFPNNPIMPGVLILEARRARFSSYPPTLLTGISYFILPAWIRCVFESRCAPETSLS